MFLLHSKLFLKRNPWSYNLSNVSSHLPQTKSAFFVASSIQKIGVVTNTRAVWETARGICSALSEQRSRSDRASGRERVNINHCSWNRGSDELRDLHVHAKLPAWLIFNHQRSCGHVPPGHLKIAQPFRAGLMIPHRPEVPQGRQKPSFTAHLEFVLIRVKGLRAKNIEIAKRTQFSSQTTISHKETKKKFPFYDKPNSSTDPTCPPLPVLFKPF